MARPREESYMDELRPGTPQASSLPDESEEKGKHDAVFGEIQETGPDYRNVSISRM